MEMWMEEGKSEGKICIAVFPCLEVLYKGKYLDLSFMTQGIKIGSSEMFQFNRR